MAGPEKKGGEQGWDEQVRIRLAQALQLLHLPPLMIHVALVLLVGWMASCLKLNLLFVFTLGFAYLCHIESRQRPKIAARIRSEQRKSTDRKRLLTDAETARWLNTVVKSVWPIFLERFASEYFLMRLAPWFLAKYKPWTAKKVVLQHLYLGKSPPVFTFFRAGRHPTDGDHLVLEMTMSFMAAKDMAASMGVQMAKRVGLGIWTSFHISDIQVEGKLKVGVRFTKGWPVIGRLRICFSEAPVIRMVAKPVFSHGVDVTDLPGIAAWLDKMIIDALEQSLVEPNLLVVDVEKLVGDLMSVNAKLGGGKIQSPGKDWYHVGKSPAVATLVVEILEADKLKPCDPNGKADPYVKILLGTTQYVTTIKRKTLCPIWHEEFHIPISSWPPQDLLRLRMRDKDWVHDDKMGHKDIDVSVFKDSQRHDIWLPLDGVKTGRLRVALTIEEIPSVEDEDGNCGNPLQSEEARNLATTSFGAGAGSTREATESTNTESDGEGSESDSDETPFENECQIVDVGAGKLGCVSCVTPGRDVVKEEACSTERLRQRSKGRHITGKGSESYKSLNKSLDKSLDGSPRQKDEVDCVHLDLATPTTGDNQVKNSKSRVSNLLRRRQDRRQDQRQDQRPDQQEKEEVPIENVPERISGETTKLVVVGTKGTEVHMQVEVDEGGLKNLEALGLQNDVVLVPETGELQAENADDDKQKLGTSKMKKIGHGMFNQASKTAHNIGHAFKKIHSGKSSSDSPQAWTDTASKNISPKSCNNNERDNSNEEVLSCQLNGSERMSQQSDKGVFDQGGDTASEAEMVDQLNRHECKSHISETCQSTTSLHSS